MVSVCAPRSTVEPPTPRSVLIEAPAVVFPIANVTPALAKSTSLESAIDPPPTNANRPRLIVVGPV